MGKEKLDGVRIAIVTVLYKSDDVLPDFFQSLGRQTGVDFHLYVIDNSPSRSGFDLAEYLAQKQGIAATFVYNNANLGVAKGNNQGIELARADGCSHVLLANNDLEFDDSHAILGLFEALESTSGLVAVPKIHYFDGDSIVWYGGGYFSPSKALAPHIGMGAKDEGQFDVVRHVEYSPTCFMLIDVIIFQKIGLMDERYFVYYDDTDFAWRMRSAGIEMVYWPQVVIRHKVSYSTGGDEGPFSIKFMTRNRIFFIRKNFSGLRRMRALVWVLGTRVLRLVKLNRLQRRAMVDGIREGIVLPLV